MNILHLTYSIEAGGLENLILNFFRQLDRNKIHLHLAVLKRGGVLEKQFIDLGVNIYYLDKEDNIDLSIPFKMRKIIKKNGIDILHTHNTGTWLYGGMTKLISYNSFKLVHTQHSPFFKEESFLLKLGKFYSVLSDEIISDSNYVTKFLVEKQKIKEKQIKLIYNGIELHKYVNAPAFDLRRELNVDNNTKIIGIVARLEPVKNHKVLIDAFNQIYQKYKAVLVLAGDGSLKRELIQYCQKNKLEDYIYFLGYRQNIQGIVQAFDLFVLSSYSEGLSLSILEAMASNVPVVASDVGGNSEIINDGENGFLFESDNCEELAQKIELIFKDKINIKKLKSNAFETVEKNFNLDKMTKSYFDIYQNVISK